MALTAEQLETQRIIRQMEEGMGASPQQAAPRGPVVRMEEKVKPLQEMLGINGPDRDGVMGPSTNALIQKRVEEFQRQKYGEGGVNGKLDKGLLSDMRNSDDAQTRRFAEALAPVQRFYVPNQAADAAINQAQQQANGTRDEIKKIQEATGAKPDGDFGPKSNAALQKKIEEVQQRAGLPVDGNYSEETAKAMRKDPKLADLAEGLDKLKSDGALPYKPLMSIANADPAKAKRDYEDFVRQDAKANPFEGLTYKDNSQSVVMKTPYVPGQGSGQLMNADSPFAVYGDLMARVGVKDPAVAVNPSMPKPPAEDIFASYKEAMAPAPAAQRPALSNVMTMKI